ncbi:hypothetical protein ACLMJK_009239 [Lecanora helva]
MAASSVRFFETRKREVRDNKGGKGFNFNNYRYLSVINQLTQIKLLRRVEKGEQGPYLILDQFSNACLIHELNTNLHERQAAFQNALELIRGQVPRILYPQPDDAWPRIVKILPHFMSLLEIVGYAEPRIKANLEFAEMLVDIGGSTLLAHGRTSEAKLVCERAEELLQDDGDCPNATTQADILTMLGLSTDMCGLSERNKGKLMREKCFQIRQVQWDALPEHDRTIEDEKLMWNANIDKACSFRQLDRVKEVEAICKKSIKDCQRWGSEEEHPNEFARYYSLNAYVHLHKGETNKAYDDINHAYGLISRGSPDSLAASRYKSNLANIMFLQGDREQAIREHGKMLDFRIRECGEDSVLVLQSRLNIGVMHYLMLEFSKARQHFLAILHSATHAYWFLEYYTKAEYYLAQTLKAEKKDPMEVDDFEVRAKATADEALRREHSNISKEYRGYKDYAFLCDYLVPWECRLESLFKAIKIEDPKG